MRAEFKVKLKQGNRAQYIRRDQKKIQKEPMLRQYLVLAHQVKKAIKTQPSRTLKEIAGWIGYTPARMSQIISLLLLSPFIQEEILLSDKSFLHKLTINEVNLIAKELLWHKQKEMWLLRINR